MSDLERLARDLREAAQATKRVQPVLHKGANNIKREWQQEWKGLAHAPRLPYAIGYDFTVGVGGASVTIGPDKDKPQGALGNLIEYGSANNGPHPAGQHALEHEEPRFIAAILEAAKIL